MATQEVTVMGAGIFGLSCAYAMAQRGAKLRVIETRAIGAGSSGGVVGALSPHVPENWNPKKAFQLESLLMAADFWAAVSHTGGLPSGYLRSGRLQPLADARAVEIAQARGHSAQALWRDHATWRVVASGQSEWEPHSPTGLLVHDDLTARLHPLMACRALTAAIRALGGDVLIGPHDTRGPVLWATGYAGLLDLNAHLNKPVGGGVKGQALSLRFDAPDLPQIFSDGLHIVPHVDGTVAIGSTSERDWDTPDSTDAQLDDLHARAIAALPQLAHAPLHARWAGIRPRSKSRAPMLGAWPDRAGHYIANGGFKIGFGMAPKVAQCMADLLLEGLDTIPSDFQVAASL